MVNFTEKLEANTRAEWAAHYVDYRALKKAMKKAAGSLPCSPDALVRRDPIDQLKEPFLAGPSEEGNSPVEAFRQVLHTQRGGARTPWPHKLGYKDKIGAPLLQVARGMAVAVGVSPAASRPLGH